MKKKLVLNRETIRNLDEKDLDQVRGGKQVTQPPICTVNANQCYWVTPKCPQGTIMPICIVHSMEC